MNDIISATNLSKVYPGVVPTIALDALNFSIKKGSFTAIIGQSGSGKSTLLNIIGALDRPSSGKRLDVLPNLQICD